MMNKITLPLFLVILAVAVSCSSIKGMKPEKKQLNLIWTKNNDPVHETGNLPIAFNSPLIYEELLFVGHNSGKMMAYELATGRMVWQQADNGTYHTAPVAHEDYIIYGTTEGRVYVRNFFDGELKYSVDLGASIESPGVIHKGRILFHLRNHQIFCLDIKTGKILWAYKRAVPMLTTLQRVSTPVIANNRVYIGFADGHIAAFSLEEGILLWEQKLAVGEKFVDVDVTPLLYQGKLYVGSLSGSFFVLDPRTGNVKRQIPITVSRVPIKSANGLIMGTADGELVRLDRQNQIVMRKQLGDLSISSIIPLSDKLFVSTVGGSVFCVNANNFTVIEHFDLGHSASAVFGSMRSNGEMLALLSSRNRIYVFKHN